MSSDTAAAVTSITGIPQEAQNRLVLEANVTDVTAIVDIYLIDIEPTPPRAGKVAGQESQRWITPNGMTGEVGAVGSNGILISGGITTQFTGPQPGRARIRATKANPGILVSPTRYVRVAARSLCDPANINSTAKQFLPAVTNPTQVPCLNRAVTANGLRTGQYFAPTFEYIFPENVVAGDPIVPNDFWAMGFLINGEGGSGAPGDTLQAGGLTPTPW